MATNWLLLLNVNREHFLLHITINYRFNRKRKQLQHHSNHVIYILIERIAIFGSNHSTRFFPPISSCLFYLFLCRYCWIVGWLDMMNSSSNGMVSWYLHLKDRRALHSIHSLLRQIQPPLTPSDPTTTVMSHQYIQIGLQQQQRISRSI